MADPNLADRDRPHVCNVSSVVSHSQASRSSNVASVARAAGSLGAFKDDSSADPCRTMQSRCADTRLDAVCSPTCSYFILSSTALSLSLLPFTVAPPLSKALLVQEL